MRKIVLYILSFYQRFLTVIFGYGSCRYYPTCSEYAKWQVENNNLLKALFFSILRVLKCNQLFRGGIEYPMIRRDFKFPILKPKNNMDIEIKYWFVSKKDNIFYVIKDFKRYKKC